MNLVALNDIVSYYRNKASSSSFMLRRSIRTVMSFGSKKAFCFSEFKFLSVWCCIAFARALFVCAFLLFFSIAPRLELHGLHDGTRLFSIPPPSTCAIRWSASVATPPHQWHCGFSCSSKRLAFAYSLSLVVLCRGISRAFGLC